MSELPARKRPMRVLRQLDHDAVDARLNASLLDYGRLLREAGLSSDDAVNRLRALLDDGGEPGSPPRSWPTLPRVSARSVVGAIGLVALVVAVGIGWKAVDNPAARPPPDRVVDPSPIATAAEVPPPGVAGFAEMYVAAYLGQAGEGAEEVLDPFLTQRLPMLGLAPGRLYVQNLATFSVEAASQGWSVSVAAQTLRRVDRGYGDPIIQYYRVEVRDDGGYVTDSLPTPIDGF